MTKLPAKRRRTAKRAGEAPRAPRARPTAAADNLATFRDLVDQSPLMVFVNQRAGVVYTNEATSRLLGYGREEVLAPTFDFRSLLTPQSQPIAQEAFGRHQRGEEVEPIEYVLLSKQGQPVPVVIATRLIGWNGEPAILGVVTDLSETKAATAALQQSEARYRTLLETCPDGIVAVDMTGQIVLANQAAAHMRGYASVEALLANRENAFDNIVESQRELALRNMELTLRTGRVERFEYDTYRADRSILPIELTVSVLATAEGIPTGFVGVVRDLSEKRAAEAERASLEEQVRHGQRLESLGVLAGGIAHDFNNLLVGILGNAHLALHEAPPASQLGLCLEQIVQAARSAAELTAQMLAYAGKGPTAPVNIDLASTIREMTSLLEAAVPKRVLLHPILAERLPPVLADPGQLKQVVMNLITNAGEAMPDRGGVVEVELDLVPSPSHPPPGLIVGEFAATRDYVRLAVRDTGCGMDKATRERMFDPFFTTKFTGRGLGLAAVLGIVRNHGGLLAVESALGRGTTITVWWPAHQPDGEQTRPARPIGSAAMRLDRRPVLVVDDEPMVLSVAERALTLAGVEVLTAGDGATALELVRARGHELAAIVLDLTMPGMSGAEVMRDIRALAPDLPIIMSSGYSRTEAFAHSPDDEQRLFIQKPYDPAALVALVHTTVRAHRT